MTRFRAIVALSLAIAGLTFLTEQAAGLRAVYFSDVQFGQPASRSTSNVTSEALLSDAPVRLDMPFSVEWSGYLHVASRGRYVFWVDANGPAAILINGRKVVGDLNVGVGVGNPGDIELDPGVHSIVVRYVHSASRPAIAVRMAMDDQAPRIVPFLELSPLRRTPILYTSASLIRLAAIATFGLWAAAFGVWLVKHVQGLVLTVVAGVTALFIAGVVYDTPSWLRGPAPYPYQWQWAYQEPITTSGVGTAVGAALALLAIVAYLSVGKTPRSPRARTILGLTGATIAAAAFQIALLGTDPDGAAAVLTNHTLSADFNSYFDVASRMPSDVGPFLKTYVANLPNLERHAATHPPGPILYYRAIIRFLERSPRSLSAVLSILRTVDVKPGRIATDNLLLFAAAFVGGLGVALSVAVAVWPVAAIAEAAGADPLMAAQAGALWGLCPSAVVFSAQFDQVVTLLVASTCALGCVALTARRPILSNLAALGAGALAALAVFCSFGALPMLGAAAATCVVIAFARGRSWAGVWRVAGLAAVGFAAASSVPVVAGYDPLGAARAALSLHRSTYTLSRGRGLWMRFNLLDFAIFLGLPIISLRIARLISPGTQGSAESRGSRVLFWTVLALVAALDLADVTRGEVGRLWMPLTPMAFLAMLPVENGPGLRQLAGRVLVGGSLALVCVFLRLYWNPG